MAPFPPSAHVYCLAGSGTQWRTRTATRRLSLAVARAFASRASISDAPRFRYARWAARGSRNARTLPLYRLLKTHALV
eukprot:4132844-Lingulodinium_polyedra.AAC.1